MPEAKRNFAKIASHSCHLLWSLLKCVNGWCPEFRSDKHNLGNVFTSGPQERGEKEMLTNFYAILLNCHVIVGKTCRQGTACTGGAMCKCRHLKCCLKNLGHSIFVAIGLFSKCSVRSRRGTTAIFGTLHLSAEGYLRVTAAHAWLVSWHFLSLLSVTAKLDERQWKTERGEVHLHWMFGKKLHIPC